MKEKQQITNKGIPVRLSADFSGEIVGQRVWHDKVMKGKSLQPITRYLARLSLRFDGEIKSFIGKQVLKEFSTNKPALQQMLKDPL